MIATRISHVFGLLVVAALLSACSLLGDGRSGGTGSSEVDGPGRQIEPDDVADAIPKKEPPSRYGNPSSYVVFGKRYKVVKSSAGYVERGIASWYGKKFHGRRTSSGEVFDMYLATAAHRSLPLPTYAVVTNLDNNKRITVKINDRGPFHSNRIIDLSYGAAVKIGFGKAGTGRVEVRAINVGADADADVVIEQPAAVTESYAKRRTFIQIGAFQHVANAQEMRARAQDAGLLDVSVEQASTASGSTLHKVRVGPYVDPAKIESVISKLQSVGISAYKLHIE